MLCKLPQNREWVFPFSFSFFYLGWQQGYVEYIPVGLLGQRFSCCLLFVVCHLLFTVYVYLFVICFATRGLMYVRPDRQAIIDRLLTLTKNKSDFHARNINYHKRELLYSLLSWGSSGIICSLQGGVESIYNGTSGGVLYSTCRMDQLYRHAQKQNVGAASKDVFCTQVSPVLTGDLSVFPAPSSRPPKPSHLTSLQSCKMLTAQSPAYSQ